MMSSLLTAFGLGFLYFISAIPTAVALGASVWMAAAGAWLGYSAGGIIILLLGVPAQEWILRRWNFSLAPLMNPCLRQDKLFWRVLDRYGIVGLGLIAPITIGPQLAALVLLTLRINPKKIAIAISLGVLPWILVFVGFIETSSHFLKKMS